MKRLEFLRRDRGLSQRQLGAAAQVNASYICNAERRGLVLYPEQAKRLAAALDWSGDPTELFEEVVADDLASKLS